jgi:hypothetical protein
MPNIIAHDIIGVQPMTGPVGSIFNSTWTLDSVVLTKDHFKHFLRVYNRKKYHKLRDITALGYATIDISAFNTFSARQWCRETLKPGSFVCSNARFCFAYEQDYVMFMLRWG